MNKFIDKSRRAFITYLYSLPSRWGGSVYCAKGEAVIFCSGEAGIIGLGTILPAKVENGLGITGDQWYEMERRFEGWSVVPRWPCGPANFKRHDFSDIAEWLQTLPGWPQVLGPGVDA